jgi:hypothetical protein
VALPRLNLTEDELIAKITSRLKIAGDKPSGFGGSSSVSGNFRDRGRGRGRNGGRHGGRNSGRGGKTVVNDECRYCRNTGHWARDCWKKKRDEQSHAVHTEEVDEALLLARTSVIDIQENLDDASASLGPHQVVHLREDKLYIQLGDKVKEEARWILDMGATNHMIGERTAFSSLNEKVQGTVRFGDGSVMAICGRRFILLHCRNGDHKTLTGVYYIPRLTTNIVSLGQLEEGGHKILMLNGHLKIWDTQRRLLASVSRSVNRLYELDLDVAKPVCLAAQGGSAAWRWHARLGHLNFQSLRRLAKEEMVRRLPQIDHADHVCDSCLAGKQRRLSFLGEVGYHATHRHRAVTGFSFFWWMT